MKMVNHSWENARKGPGQLLAAGQMPRLLMEVVPRLLAEELMPKKYNREYEIFKLNSI
jgi:hypothetical protein